VFTKDSRSAPTIPTAGRACSRSRETLWDTQLWSQCQGNGRVPVLWCIVCTHKCSNLLVAWCHLLPGNQTVAKLHTIAVPYINHWYGGAVEHVQAITQQAQTQWSTHTGSTTILWSTATPTLSGQCYEVGVLSSEWSTGEMLSIYILFETMLNRPGCELDWWHVRYNSPSTAGKLVRHRLCTSTWQQEKSSSQQQLLALLLGNWGANYYTPGMGNVCTAQERLGEARKILIHHCDRFAYWCFRILGSEVVSACAFPLATNAHFNHPRKHVMSHDAYSNWGEL